MGKLLPKLQKKKKSHGEFWGFPFLAVIMCNTDFMFILPIKTHCLFSRISVRILILHHKIMLLQDFHVKIENNSHDFMSCFTTLRYLQSNDILLLNNGNLILHVSIVPASSDNVSLGYQKCGITLLCLDK